jgi:hypothetical protein
VRLYEVTPEAVEVGDLDLDAVARGEHDGVLA